MIAYYKALDNLKFLFDESLTIKRSLCEESEPLLTVTGFSGVITAAMRLLAHRRYFIYVQQMQMSSTHVFENK